MHGHLIILHFAPNKLSLQCGICGYESEGWEVGRPLVARRHADNLAHAHSRTGNVHTERRRALRAVPSKRPDGLISFQGSRDTMNDLTMTNVWLGILAVISLVEFLMIAAAGLFAYKAYKQVMTAVETVERVHIAPLRARVDGILDEVEVITGKVRHAQESVASVFTPQRTQAASLPAP